MKNAAENTLKLQKLPPFRMINMRALYHSRVAVALWDNYFLPTLLLLVPLHQRANMQLATAAKNVNETNLKAKAKT